MGGGRRGNPWRLPAARCDPPPQVPCAPRPAAPDPSPPQEGKAPRYSPAPSPARTPRGQACSTPAAGTRCAAKAFAQAAASSNTSGSNSDTAAGGSEASNRPAAPAALAGAPVQVVAAPVQALPRPATSGVQQAASRKRKQPGEGWADGPDALAAALREQFERSDAAAAAAAAAATAAPSGGQPPKSGSQLSLLLSAIDACEGTPGALAGRALLWQRHVSTTLPRLPPPSRSPLPSLPRPPARRPPAADADAPL